MFTIIGFFQILIVAIFISIVLKCEKRPQMIISKIILFSISLTVLKYLVINYLYNPGYPNSTFLFDPNDRFNDFVNMINTCKDLDPYDRSNFLPSVYFPISNLFYSVLYELSDKNLAISMIVYTILFLIALIILINKIFLVENKQFIILSILFSYPVIFSLDRMNLELFVFLLTLGFVYYYQERKFLLAVFLLSIGISMKLYPILFLIFFIKDRNFKFILLSGLMCISITIFSLFLFKGGLVVNSEKLLFNLNNFNDIYVGPSGLQHNLSLYGMIKIMVLGSLKFIFNYSNYIANSTANEILRIPYLIFVFMYFILISTLVIFIEKSFWKNIYLITSLIILLPHVSFDYKLLYIIIPLLYFLKEVFNDKYSVIYSVLFSLLMIPHSYFYLIYDISIGVFIFPLIFLVVTYIIIKENNNDIRDKYNSLFKSYKPIK